MSSAKRTTSPPSSDFSASPRLPPSPPLSPKPLPTADPHTDQLIGAFHLHRAGRFTPTDDWRSFILSLSHFDELHLRIEQEGLTDWFHNKVRYDYDGRKFTLRMPSAVHECFRVAVEDRIYAELRSLAERVGTENGTAAAALKGIHKGGSITLKLEPPKLENSSQESQDVQVTVHRSPDATFYPKSAGLPTLVLEVSYSQQRKDLPRLAESYIVDSQHAIRCVVGLDITYNSAKKGKKQDRTASVSVWRPIIEVDSEGENVGSCSCDVDAVPFRDAAGDACAGDLQLLLRDLLPQDAIEELTDAPEDSITIPFADLATYLAEAEATQLAARIPPVTSVKKFRKRKRSPCDDLSAEKETAYLKAELAELEKETSKDADWGSKKQKTEEVTQAGAEVEVVRRRNKRRSTGEGS